MKKIYKLITRVDGELITEQEANNINELNSPLPSFSIIGVIIGVAFLVWFAFMGASYVAMKKFVHVNPPKPHFIRRYVKANTNHKGDTLSIEIIDKREYILKGLKADELIQLRESLK